MFLGLGLCNNSFTSSAIPARRTFTKVDIMGQSIIDEMHIHNSEMTDNAILALNSLESFGSDSILLAHYENNLQGGDYVSLDTPITSYDIEKRIVGESQYTLVTNITQESGINTYLDYTSKNKKQYEYAIFPKDANGVVGSSTTALIEQDFYGWFLVAQDNSISYKFDMEINSDTLQVMEDFKEYENYTEMAVVSRGKRKYVKGKLSTIPYSISGQELIIDVDLLNVLKDFINDGKPKYLKNTLGELFLVSTNNYNYKYNDVVPSQIYTISFDFVQIG